MNFKTTQLFLERDGNMWLARGPDFINLHDSIVGFGGTIADAVGKYMWEANAVWPHKSYLLKIIDDTNVYLFSERDDTGIPWSVFDTLDHSYNIFHNQSCIMLIALK